MIRHWAILDPNAVRTHHVGHQHVCEEAIPDDRDLRFRGNARFWGFAEVVHDLGVAAWLLHFMPKNFHTGVLLQCFRILEAFIGVGAG